MHKINISSLLFTLCSALLFSLTSVQTSWSQTIYKQEKGLFTGLPTLHSQSGALQSFTRVGPWAGYRFNKNIDLTLLVEYVTSEKRMFSDEFSLYNIGITGGYTHHMPRLKWRSSLSLYRVFNIKTDPEARIFPEGFSVGASSGLYMPIKLSRRITLLPNGTLYAGTGKAQIPNGTLSGHSDGVWSDAGLGVDVNTAFSAFTFTLGGGYIFDLASEAIDSGSSVFLTLVLNF